MIFTRKNELQRFDRELELKYIKKMKTKCFDEVRK